MTPARAGQVELHRLIYTANWEDPESDRLALQFRPGDTVLTITSGGCNTLGFLLHDPAIIHAVDINPAQAYHLELKMAAMRKLAYGEFVSFLGLRPSPDRLATYAVLRPGLSPAAASFWDARRALVQKGLQLRGSYDRFVKLVRRYIRLGHGRRRIEGLLSAKDMEEQRTFYDRYWDILRTHLVFVLFYNKRVLARMGLQPDYFRFDDGSRSFAESFRRKFRKVCHDVPLRGNYFVHLYLKGCYRSLDEVPDYLREENYGTIRGRLDRVRVATADAKIWLAGEPEASIDAFALSNICELMDLADTRRTFLEVLRTARPGARISFRNLIIPRDVPEDLRGSIRKDEETSRRMKDTDRSFVYSKVAAYEVVK
jgi:S-adenosylmethionine-diacylglycerol 3-amino-3-carboxypropyl transferase